MNPLWSAVNLTPSSSEFESLLLALTGVEVVGKMVHGHVTGPGVGVLTGVGVRVGVGVAVAGTGCRRGRPGYWRWRGRGRCWRWRGRGRPGGGRRAWHWRAGGRGRGVEDRVYPVVGGVEAAIREGAGGVVGVDTVATAGSAGRSMHRRAVHRAAEVVRVDGVVADGCEVRRDVGRAGGDGDGEAKLTCCQPEEVSPENAAVASRVPVRLHRLPTWVPVLPVSL